MQATKVILIAIALTFSCSAQAQSTGALLDRLVRAYPEALVGHDDRSILWRDGTRMPADEPRGDKSFEDMLRNASILDQLKLPYPRGEINPPGVNVDPGRFRNEAFFKKMYGDCSKGEVARHLVPIVWLPRSWGKTVYATRVNGVADSLKEISSEIDALEPSIKKAAYPIAGVLSCRPVADTGKMSMHGYAAAIDLNLGYSDYWLWNRKAGGIPYRNRMPKQIIDIFERHGFIWGGRWYHYDTMHFEYRPELLLE